MGIGIMHGNTARCFVLLGLLSLIVFGCGSDSSSSNSGETTTVTAKQGVLIDSVLIGVDYEGPTYSGVTDENGHFDYLEGEIVTFSIGDLAIGSSTGKDYVTPLDLVPGATDVTDPTVTNICKLLQVLDEDGDLSNGIHITDAIKDIVSDADLDFDADTDEFENDPDVQGLLDDLNDADVFTGGDRDLPTDQEAQDHLQDTLDEFPITFDYAYLQYRTYEDGSHVIRGWISLYRNENSISESDITNIELKNSSEDIIPLSWTSFWVDPYYFGNWNSDSSMVDYRVALDSGFSIGIDGSVTTLPAGDYTYAVTTEDGNVLTKTVYYPGDTNMPCVDDNSMAYTWQQDRSLKLTWDPPVNQNYDELRVVLEGQNEDEIWESLVYIKLPVGASEVIIPSSQIQKIEDLNDPYMTHWQVQTRSYTDDRNMYARGYSDRISFPWQEDAPVPITFDYAYLQYRTYEDDSHAVRGWNSFYKNGNPIDESDIIKIELKDEDGNIIPVSGISYWKDTSYYGRWNSDESTVDYDEPFTDSGFSVRFDSVSTLPTGDYTYEATTVYGNTITRTVHYPGDTVIPCVDDNNMAYEWLQSGDLKLTWDAPDVQNYDEIRVTLDEQNEFGAWGSLVSIKLPASAVEVIIPSTQIQKIEDLDEPVLAHWQVQTRFNTDEGNNYARGYSDTVSFLWDARDLSLTVAGESGSQVDLDGIWRQWCWPDYDDNESSDEATTISGSSFTTKQYGWIDTTECSGEPWIEIILSGTATLGSEVMIGSNFGEITVTRVDLAHDTMTATVYDSDMADALNADTACGYTDWAVGVSKSLIGTDCEAAAKDIIYIDDTGDDDVWYTGCNEDECAQDEGYPAELQHDQAKYRYF